MFNDIFTENGCSGIIETWCSGAGAYDKCCGLCHNTSISGNGQIIWAFLSTLSICTCLCLASGKAWPILGAQALFTVSQNFAVWLVMSQGPRAISRWQASYMFCLSQSWVPICCAVFFSPVWSQNGNTPQKVIELELEQRERQAKYDLEHPAARRQPTDLSEKPRTPAFQRAATWTSTTLRLRSAAATQATSDLKDYRKKVMVHLHRGLAIKSAIAGAVWLLVMIGSTFFMGSMVWGGDYDFAERACEETEDVQRSLKGIRIFSYLSLTIGFLLILAQTFFPMFLKKGGAELFLHYIHRPLKKVSTALNGKAEKHEELKRKKALEEEEERQKIVRDTEWIQRGATFSMFLLWTVGCAAIYGDASARFLLQGADAWTFGQIQPLVILVPNVLALFTTWRARQETQIALAEVHKRQRATIEPTTRTV